MTQQIPMASIPIAKWVAPHFYKGRRFEQLSQAELAGLRDRLHQLNSPNPEVSIVIPAFNEGDRIHRTLSSLAHNRTCLRTELIVINNNSTDHTQQVLDSLGVRSFFQPLQGIAYARQMGLEKARGTFHLCADADTLYPPDWIELMTRPMRENKEIVGVYGRYAIIPPEGFPRFGLWLYETLTGVLFRIRRRKKEHINVLGFNMGFITDLGRKLKGFEVEAVRKFSNSRISKDYTEISEDGQMAYQLKTVGRLKMITHPKARVYTSARKLLQDGSITKAFANRLKTHGLNIMHYCFPNDFQPVYRRHEAP